MLRKIPYDTSDAILARFEPSEELDTLALANESPEAAMRRMREADLMIDYVSFVAHALPPREAICWGLACQESAPGHAETAKVPDIALQENAMALVRSWVREPQENVRFKAMGLTESLGTDHAIGWLCYALVWNGTGSIVEANLPAVMPEPYLHAKALLGAVALLYDGEDETEKAFMDCIDHLAMEVAAGGWPGLGDR